MKLHPTSWILGWCLLVASLQGMALQLLLIAAVLLLAGALYWSRHKFKVLLRRTRWIMLSLLLIYAYVTPGEALIDDWSVFSPTYEGLLDGALQLLRLLLALASLAVLLDKLHRLQLIAGLYGLLWPLQWILPRERLAVRLALTLHYAEVVMMRQSEVSLAGLQQLFELPEVAEKTLTLTLDDWSWRDVLSVVLAILLLGWVYL